MCVVTEGEIDVKGSGMCQALSLRPAPKLKGKDFSMFPFHK